MSDQRRPIDESSRFWGAIGIVLNILPTVVVAMTKNLLWLILLALPFSGIVSYETSKYWLQSAWKRAVITVIGSVISGLLFFILWLYVKPPQIYNQFVPAYSRYEALLGNPVSAESTVPEAIEEWSDSAHIIWLSNVPIICAFPLQEGQGYVCERDRRITESKYWDKNYIEKSLHLRKNDFPPTGGIAYFLINEPNKWGWVGKVNTACTIINVHYQRFAGGDIWGPFPAADGKSPLQFFIVTLPDGEWRSVSGSDESQEQCKRY